MTTDLDTLKALVAAGKKATQGEYNFDHLDRAIYTGDIEIIISERFQFVQDGRFLATAANSRQALKRLIERHEAMEKALEISIGYVALVADGVGKMPILKDRAKSDLEILSKAVETGGVDDE